MNFLSLIVFITLTSCASKKCLNNSNYLEKANETVWVYKYDGTKQCNAGDEILLEKMRQDLTGIQVLEQKKANDRLMRIKLCGTPTGAANTFKIKKTDLKKAEERGFARWSF